MGNSIYLPLKYADSMGMGSLAETLKKAAWSCTGKKKQELYKAVCEEIGKLTPDDALKVVQSPGFFTDSYRGGFKNLNSILRKGKSFSRKTFGEGNFKEEWQDFLTMSAICSKWAENKQVYEFDADFAMELTDTQELTLYPEILKHLPYDTFYLEHTNIERFAPVNGTFVHIHVSHDDSMQVYLYRVVNNIYLSGCYKFDAKDADKDGKYTCYKFDKNLIRHKNALKAFTYTKDGEERQFDNSGFEDMAAFYFQAIFYLCSKRPDIKENTATKKLHIVLDGEKPDAGEISSIQKWDVGLYYGRVIRAQKDDAGRAERKDIEREAYTPSGIRKPVRPHCRCAHWHHYWTGKGRTNLEIRWIQPSYVGAVTDRMPLHVNKVVKR